MREGGREDPPGLPPSPSLRSGSARFAGPRDPWRIFPPSLVRAERGPPSLTAARPDAYTRTKPDTEHDRKGHAPRRQQPRHGPCALTYKWAAWGASPPDAASPPEKSQPGREGSGWGSVRRPASEPAHRFLTRPRSSSDTRPAHGEISTSPWRGHLKHRTRPRACHRPPNPAQSTPTRHAPQRAPQGGCRHTGARPIVDPRGT